MPLSLFPRISAAAFALLLLFGGGAGLFADPSLESLSDRVQRLESSLALIQKQQDKILLKQAEILEKLDTVKVWARRG